MNRIGEHTLHCHDGVSHESVPDLQPMEHSLWAGTLRRGLPERHPRIKWILGNGPVSTADALSDIRLKRTDHVLMQPDISHTNGTSPENS